jgi:L-threonylcarbamoyladenylate synthase
VQGIAQGLFSALRTLDEAGCQVIVIEGISDTEGDLAAAVMNRLRKAAEVDVR